MRCLTLANALQSRGAQICFVSRHLPEYFRELVARHGHSFLLLPAIDQRSADDFAHASWLGVSQEADAQASLDALSSQFWDWLIVDHYALDIRWERELRQTTRRILVIDDLADREHDCDVLIDQNFYLDMPSRYSDKVPAHCQLMLGPKFALLRDEFRDLLTNTRFRQAAVERILVFFGGVDAANYTGEALRALVDIGIGGIHVDVVLGAQHPFLEEIEKACIRYGFECHVQTSRMAELMASADLAIGAGGTATWERCCLGLPAIAVSTAENQRRQLADAAAMGLVYAPEVGGDFYSMLVRHLMPLIENSALRQCISSNGMNQVDGNGVLRAVMRTGCTGVSIRKASFDDSKCLYTWRNHPEIRAVSRSSDVIDWEAHCCWFAAVLGDPLRQLLIGQRDGEPVGVVRFDIHEDQAEVSIYLVPDAKVTCRGSELLQSAEFWLAENRPEVKMLHAHVLGGNVRSQRMFFASGYEVENMILSKKLH